MEVAYLTKATAQEQVEELSLHAQHCRVQGQRLLHPHRHAAKDLRQCELQLRLQAPVIREHQQLRRSHRIAGNNLGESARVPFRHSGKAIGLASLKEKGSFPAPVPAAQRDLPLPKQSKDKV